jgi:hypothetical protein
VNDIIKHYYEKDKDLGGRCPNVEEALEEIRRELLKQNTRNLTELAQRLIK